MGHHHSKGIFIDIGHFFTHTIPHTFDGVKDKITDFAHDKERDAGIEIGHSIYEGAEHVWKKSKEGAEDAAETGEKVGADAGEATTDGLESAGVSDGVAEGIGITAEGVVDAGAAEALVARPPPHNMKTVSAQNYLNKRGEVNTSKRIDATMLVPAGQMLAAPPKAIQPKLKPLTIAHHPDVPKAGTHSHIQTVRHKGTHIAIQSKPNSIPESYATYYTSKVGSHKLAPALAMN